MRVRFEPVDGVAVERMIVAECEHHHAGQCVGYRCQHCGEADETLQQIYHDPDCELVGEHGRQHYDELKADLDAASPSPELQEENPIWVVISAETDRSDDVYVNDVVAFRCRCGNLDDDLFEVVHDEACPLADEDCELGRTDADNVSSLRVAGR
jgi:hypothetical protein